MMRGQHVSAGASSASCSILGTSAGTREQSATSPRRRVAVDSNPGRSLVISASA